MSPERRGSMPWRAVLLWVMLVVGIGGIAVAGAWARSPAAGASGDAVAAPPGFATAAVPARTDATPPGMEQAPPPRQQAQARQGFSCEQCHGELELLRQQAGTLTRAEQLLVPQHVVALSAHGGMSCAECHTGYTGYPHDGRVTRSASCESCHTDAADLWSHGSHASADEVVGCVQCHGSHDVRTIAELRSPAGTALANAPCISCHETVRLEAHAPHSDGVLCAACHAPHDVRPVHDPASWMSPARQVQTCGACHDSIAAVWQGDIHGDEALRRAHLAGRQPQAEVVVCTSCHIGHQMLAPDNPAFALESVQRCAECHDHATQTFFGSYHGKATALGSRVSASCADCHGAHGILPASMPESRIAPANLVETCRDCHEYARPAFVLYDPHPDVFDRSRNPWIFLSFWTMNGLLIFVLLVFGAHTILWWIRLWLDKRRGIIHGPGHGDGDSHGQGGHE
jgi:hypothetical protein